MKAIVLFIAVLAISRFVQADVHSCSEPLQTCTAPDETTLTIEGCSVTCAEGVAAICFEGSFVEPTVTPACEIHSDSKCFCAGDDRGVQELGDHE